jgi:glutamate dehydrogenase/leucine dehydrogenase
MDRVLGQAYAEVQAASQREQTTLRTAALMLAVRRVTEAITLRGFYP